MEATETNNMHEMLMQRHQERLAKFEARRQARIIEKAESNENSEAFLHSFNKEKREIVLLLNNLSISQPKLQITNSFDEISQKILMLQKYVSDSLSFLPGYDMRRAQEILKRMRADVNDKREVLLPKKKFAFKSRQKLTSQNGTDKNVKENSKISKDIGFKPTDNVGFSGRCKETLSLEYSECEGKDLCLSNLEDCTVYIQGHPSAMRIDKVINTKIFCGPVSRSIFVSDCFDCSFQLACQQLRIHTTASTKFYIHVTSKAIIEDSDDVGFAPYTWSYGSINEHFKEAGLSIDTNNWKDVDDFNWLKLDETSPNWYIIKE